MNQTDDAGRGGGSICDQEWMVGPYVDGELPSGERAGLEDHMTSCTGCSELAEQLRNFDRLARTASSTPRVSAEEWGELWYSIEHRVGKRQGAAPLAGTRGTVMQGTLARWLVPALSAAALLALAVWLGARVFDSGEESREPTFTEVKIIESKGEGARPVINEDADVIDYTAGGEGI